MRTVSTLTAAIAVTAVTTVTTVDRSDRIYDERFVHRADSLDSVKDEVRRKNDRTPRNA